MMSPMKSHMLSRVLGILPVLVFAAPLMAEDGDGPVIDARLLSYGGAAATEQGSTATMWMLAVAFGLVAFGVMFINAKRTHLD